MKTVIKRSVSEFYEPDYNHVYKCNKCLCKFTANEHKDFYKIEPQENRKEIVESFYVIIDCPICTNGIYINIKAIRKNVA